MNYKQEECLSLKPSLQSSVALLIQAITFVRIGDIPPLYSGLHQINASDETKKSLTFVISSGKSDLFLKSSSNSGLYRGKLNCSNDIIEQLISFYYQKIS